ncbi:37S ribosomal protein S11 [Pochonia chlamydosporia 170]|uniref:37S ribosomal protein S11 n=1 Tax=Pochonia chlamydosporia 170 TaxID=1380566 RepID=A0A179FGJ1_METCM|nr:37S ribosomal protein S11 [Pochonia chlamydosporia 170]OAQ64113.1 37S ribosomal protein S11 [Pochonia chlamydosporia 170]
MSRSLTNRLTALPSLRQLNTAIPKCPSQASRLFSRSTAQWDDSKTDRPKRVQARPKTEDLLESVFNSPSLSRSQAAQPNTMSDLSQSMVFNMLNNKPNIDTSALSGQNVQPAQRREDTQEPYHFHVYSHKHNTHITCTKPNREPIISMSCGNIGFRKSRRGTFDSAYSLTKYVLERLIHTGWPMKIQRLELVLRGFGQGREAAVKVLMSPEGKILRDKIVRVADSTRIKFAGTRSKKPRRL